MADDKKRLSQDDWAQLFPEKPYKLASVELAVKPLTLTQLAVLKRNMEDAGPKISERGINRENYANPENMIFLTGLVVDIMPDVLSEVTGLHADDIVRLPIEELTKLVNFIIEMNLESRDSLEKNLKALGQTMESLLYGTSETPSSNSLKTGTDGKMSKTTPKAK